MFDLERQEKAQDILTDLNSFSNDLGIPLELKKKKLEESQKQLKDLGYEAFLSVPYDSDQQIEYKLQEVNFYLIEIDLSERTRLDNLIDKLLESELYGDSRAEVMINLVSRQIESMLESGLLDKVIK